MASSSIYNRAVPLPSNMVGPGISRATTTLRPLKSTPSELPWLTRNSRVPSHHPWSITISSFTPNQQGHITLQLHASTSSPDTFHAIMNPHNSKFASISHVTWPKCLYYLRFIRLFCGRAQKESPWAQPS